MANPDYAQLRLAMRSGRTYLKPFREKRVNLVREYHGGNWGEDSIYPADAVNMLAMYVEIVGRSLIANSPRVMLSTFNRKGQPAVAVAQDWMNERIESLHLASVFKRIIVDGMFNIGIPKVSLATPAAAAHWQWGLEAGQPYLARVDLDDFVYDCKAYDFGEASFIGHRYRCPLDVIRDDRNYGKGRKDLTPSRDDDHNTEGDVRIQTLGRASSNYDEFEEYVDLWEVYLPRHKMVVTFADDEGAVEPLMENEWIGPDCGPYPDFLGFQTVPGSAMPLAPLMHIADMNRAFNRGWRKIIRQTDRLKVITLVQGQASEDGDRTLKASDGDAIFVDNPEAVREIILGGPNPALHAMMVEMKGLISWLCGNLDSLGGLEAQSKTATQDKMLAASSSAGVADKQDLSLRTVTKCIESMLWFYWHHPTQKMSANFAVEGLPEVSTMREATPQDRQESLAWDEIKIRVDPYSLRAQTPQQRAEAIIGVVERVYLPLVGMAQQQGITLDLNALLDKLGKYLDQPDLKEILTYMEPQPQEPQEGPEEPGMPASTTRAYERINRSEATGKGQDGAKIQALMGQNPGGSPNRNGKAKAGSY